MVRITIATERPTTTCQRHLARSSWVFAQGLRRLAVEPQAGMRVITRRCPDTRPPRFAMAWTMTATGSIDDALTGALCPLVQNGVVYGGTRGLPGHRWLVGLQRRRLHRLRGGQRKDVRELRGQLRRRDDNDCDGTADNNLPAEVCPDQLGVCAGSTTPCGGASGWQVCDKDGAAGLRGDRAVPTGWTTTVMGR